MKETSNEIQGSQNFRKCSLNRVLLQASRFNLLQAKFVFFALNWGSRCFSSGYKKTEGYNPFIVFSKHFLWALFHFAFPLRCSGTRSMYFIIKLGMKKCPRHLRQFVFLSGNNPLEMINDATREDGIAFTDGQFDIVEASSNLFGHQFQWVLSRLVNGWRVLLLIIILLFYQFIIIIINKKLKL